MACWLYVDVGCGHVQTSLIIKLFLILNIEEVLTAEDQ